MNPAVKRIGHALIPQYAAGLAFAGKWALSAPVGRSKTSAALGCIHT